MAVYTQLKKVEIQVIAKDYALDVLDFKPLSGGSENSNFLVTALQGNYVFSVLEELGFPDANKLVQLLLLLKEHKFPTPRIVIPVHGEPVKLVRGKPVLIKKYIDGTVFRDLKKSMLNQVGAALARLHQIPLPSFLSQRLPYGVSHYPTIKGRNIDPEYEAWASEKFAIFKREIPSGLPWGLIHSDLFFSNVLFKGDQLIAIIDFMDAFPYFLVYDLGMGVIGLCCQNSVINMGKARALIDGYQNIRPLKKREIDFLQFFTEYAATAVSGWRFWSFHFDKPSSAKSDKHLEMKHLAEEIRKIPKEEFINVIFG